MGKNKNKTVPFKLRVQKNIKKDISTEPEMKELKRMIRTGELDPERTVDHLKDVKVWQDKIV